MGRESTPHYIGESQADIRGIKNGWYAMSRTGKLSRGPFATRESCLSAIQIVDWPPIRKPFHI